MHLGRLLKTAGFAKFGFRMVSNKCKYKDRGTEELLKYTVGVINDDCRTGFETE